MDIDVHVFFIHVLHGVCHDDGIAIAQFCVVVLQVLLGFLVLGLNELVATEPVVETFLLAYCLQYTL